MHWAWIRRSLTAAGGLWVAGTVLGVLYIGLPTVGDGVDLPVDWLPDVRHPTPEEAFAGILARNLAVYLALLLGLVTAGLSAAVLLVYNGALLGRTVAIALLAGVDGLRIVQALPHAVLELPALLAGGAIGLLGLPLFSRWLRSEPIPGELAPGVVFRIALAGGVGLVVAAVVEVWVSLASLPTVQ